MIKMGWSLIFLFFFFLYKLDNKSSLLQIEQGIHDKDEFIAIQW